MPFEQRVGGAEFGENLVVGHGVRATAIRAAWDRALQHLRRKRA